MKCLVTRKNGQYTVKASETFNLRPKDIVDMHTLPDAAKRFRDSPYTSWERDPETGVVRMEYSTHVIPGFPPLKGTFFVRATGNHTIDFHTEGDAMMDLVGSWKIAHLPFHRSRVVLDQIIAIKMPLLNFLNLSKAVEMKIARLFEDMHPPKRQWCWTRLLPTGRLLPNMVRGRCFSRPEDI